MYGLDPTKKETTLGISDKLAIEKLRTEPDSAEKTTNKDRERAKEKYRLKQIDRGHAQAGAGHAVLPVDVGGRLRERDDPLVTKLPGMLVERRGRLH